MLKLNPTISCNEDGIYYTVAKSRGRKKSLETTLKLTADFLKDAKSYRLAVAHGDAYDEGQWLKAELAKRLPHATEILFCLFTDFQTKLSKQIQLWKRNGGA